MYAAHVILRLQFEVWVSLAKLHDDARNVLIRKDCTCILGSLIAAFLHRLSGFSLSLDPTMGGHRDALGQIRIGAKALLDVFKRVLHFGELPTVFERVEAALGAKYALGIQFIRRRVRGPVEGFDYSGDCKT